MARPIWKGSISFGLVSIPVQVETAVREKSVKFHMLSKDGSCRLRRKLYCPETGDEFNWKDTARGIEVADNQYVVVEEKEIEAARPEKSKAIEIEQFVKLEEIDPIFFDNAYYVTPGEGGAKAYRLLHEAMKESGRIGIARMTLRERQNLVAVRIYGDGMSLHTLHYADEVLAIEEALPAALAKVKPNAKEVEVAKQLVEAMTKDLKLSDYKDEYREQLEELIERKRAGKETVTVSAETEEELPQPINLMDALKRSLASNKAQDPSRKSA